MNPELKRDLIGAEASRQLQSAIDAGRASCISTRDIEAIIAASRSDLYTRRFSSTSAASEP